MSVNTYRKNSVNISWTRVDLLLEIYDRAISSVDACKQAYESKDEATYATHLVKLQKAVLAIHTGLKPEESEVAANVARLLLFVADSMDAKEFETAKKVLSTLREGFAAVADEVNRMEQDGELPSISEDTGFIS